MLLRPARKKFWTPGVVYGKAAGGGGGGTGLRTNLSSFFALDNSLADSVGTVTDLTNNGSATFVADTIGGVAVTVANLVAASSQYFSHANSASLAVGGGSISVAYWVKYAAGSQDTFIAQATSAFPQNGWGVGKQFTSANFASGRVVVGASNYGATATTSAFSVGSTWYMVVFTYDGTTRTVSVSVNNAAFVTGATAPSHPTSETGTFVIGCSPALAAFQSGRVCRVAIYRGRVLNSTDVGLLWNGGAGLDYAGMA